jgi:hypothetical protein
MGAAYVQSNHAIGTWNTSLAVALSGVAAGNLLILCVASSGAGTTVTSVGDGTNSWSRVVARSFYAGAAGIEIWAAHDVASGDFTVTANFSTACACNLHLIEVSGCATSAALDDDSVGTGTSQYPDSGDAAASQDDEIAIGFLGFGATVVTEDASFTTAEVADFTRCAYQVISASRDYNYAPTYSSSVQFNCMIALFKGAGTGTTPVSKSLAIPYDLRNLVAKNLAARWDLRNLVVKSLAVRWDLRNLVAKSLAARWDLRNLVVKSLALVYSMGGLTLKSLVLSWSILRQVSSRPVVFRYRGRYRPFKKS